MQKSTDPSSAPALERGLMILETLQASGPLSLDDLAARCPIPKSSLLRLVSTLQARGYVQRRDSDKCYLNRVSFMFKPPEDRSREEKIQFALENLCRELGFTTEWYSPQKEYAQLTQRAESRDGAVQIRASIGFQRFWWGELDAVACIAHAALPLKAGPEQVSQLTRYQNGKLIPHSRNSYRKVIDGIDLNHAFYDTEYNANGIRRMAQAIRDQNGTLLGILAVPMHFQPDADARLPEHLQLLQQCSLNLQTQLQETP